MIVRAARMADAAGMAAVLNEIIAIGGTTAHATPKSADQLRLGYIDFLRTLVVAEDQGHVIGWQSAG